jgi:hypothetical protein
MPFTLCHPAAVAVLPGRLRRALPLAALAIGSMTPDFEYLLRLEPRSLWSHTIPGLVVFCLPVGLLTWIGWEQVARRPTRDLMALADDRGPLPLSPESVSRAVLAVLVGAVTHLAWDSFTHSGRLGAMLIPQLEAEAWRIGTYSLRWFSVLQHASTIAGAIVLGVWFRRERRRQGSAGVWPGRTLAVCGIVAVGLIVGGANAWIPHTLGDDSHPGRQALLARFVVGGMVGVGWSLFLYGALRRSRVV